MCIDYLDAADRLIHAEKANRKNVADEILRECRSVPVPTLYKYFSLVREDSATKEQLDLNADKIRCFGLHTIYMSSVKDFNDPFDSRCYYCRGVAYDGLSKPDRFKHLKLHDPLNFIRVACFTELGPNSMPMWGNNANNHYGFCAEFNFRSPDNNAIVDGPFKVQYVERRIDLTEYYKEQAAYFDKLATAAHAARIRAIRPDDTSAFVLPVPLANVKHSSWEHEKEYRLIKREGDALSSYASVFPAKLYIGTALDGTRYKKDLIEAAERLSIPAFQMVFEDVRETYDLAKQRVV